MTTKQAEPHATSPRRLSWPWLFAGAVVVVVAVVVTLVLATGETDSGGRGAAATSTTAGAGETGPDLGDPQAAAKSFAAAAASGSGDTLLELACVGRPACVREHAADLSEIQLIEAQDTIREGVYELGENLKGAEFSSAVDGAEPGTKEVPYRTPAMTGDAYLKLTFIQSEGDWLYYLPTT